MRYPFISEQKGMLFQQVDQIIAQYSIPEENNATLTGKTAWLQTALVTLIERRRSRDPGIMYV